MRLGSRRRSAPVLTELGRFVCAAVLALALLGAVTFFARPSWLDPETIMSKGGDPQTTAGGLLEVTQ